MSQFEHLELPRTSIELPRRSKKPPPVFGGSRNRSSHGQQLLDQVSGLTQRSKQKTSPFHLNPKLIFKIRLSNDRNLTDDDLGKSGLSILEKQPKVNQAIVVFSSDIETKEFMSSLNITLPIIIAPMKINSLKTDYKVIGTPFYCYVDNTAIIRAGGFLDPKSKSWAVFIDSLKKEVVQK